MIYFKNWCLYYKCDFFDKQLKVIEVILQHENVFELYQVDALVSTEDLKYLEGITQAEYESVLLKHL